MDSFHFSGNVSRLLVDGLTITNTKDLIIFLTGLIIAAFFVESLQRISRECFRKVPRPSQRDTQLKRRRSDRILLKEAVDETTTPQEEKSSWLEMGERNGHIQADKEVDRETSCCQGECDGVLEITEEDKETTALVGDKVTCCEDTCCEDTPELTEEQKMVRVEKMWKSLSLEVLNDRLEIYQTTCEERNDVRRNITRSDRVAFHILQTVLNMSKITTGYLFMLIVMTYNAWFLVCIVGGAGLGYLLFSSDLETLYADYAECYVMRKVKAAEDDAKRKKCSSAPCRSPSKKKHHGLKTPTQI
ncbi:uncharacterized protein LOC119729592 isoform X3 [Patiria miniata]|uniref:Copper transport protein n=1 Tax=Patiria miniata TaxID=46514 RepID=A0A914A2V0_PATMI|nr:uncharacterized protein LOC119729592 isoform X2 [Patiria miniata]XP_038058162.1 uncharacterized protein LOC119729592 isoform X3 [Patiria miniata]